MSNYEKQILSRFAKPVSLACSVTLLSGLSGISALAAPGELNSTNTGPVVQSGTYFNTSGSSTTFVNPNGSLHVQSGSLVRGLESNASSIPNGNGGTFYFRAPGNVIRIDGTVDVSAVKNGSSYVGNGGKAFFDSAYLFQNGNIFANGFNGGLVQFNVGGMTMGANARTTAQGFGGNGGVINILSPGTVDIQNGAVLETSGKVTGTFDTNIINIEGGVVNNEGIIRANGLAVVDFKTDNGDAAVITANPGLRNLPAPGTISAGTGQGILMGGVAAAHSIPGPPTNRGGTIRLVATGQTYSAANAINAASALSNAEKTTLNNRNNTLITSNNGDIVNRGTIQANGAPANDGGTLIASAARDVANFGALTANGGDAVNGVFDANGNGLNGGNGGTVSLNVMRNISNTMLIDASGGAGSRAETENLSTGSGQNGVLTASNTAGVGGNGGVLAFSYHLLDNRATIRANGGRGGAGASVNVFDVESGANPTARATATGGTGGRGGNGGLIVLSGDFNPGGGAILRADGGQGGNGGNAWADAHSSSNSNQPMAVATATAGAGGNGGSAGTVVVPSPGTLAQSQNFTAKAGGTGNSGSANFRTITTFNGTPTINTGSTPATLGSVTSGNNNPLQTTRRNELIVHNENALLLTQRAGAGTAQSTLSGRLSNALIRSLANPNGVAGNSQNAAAPATNLVIASTSTDALTNDITNDNTNPIFFNLGSLTILNNGNVVNNMHWAPGVHQVGPGFHDIAVSLGGGYQSWLSNGSITNNGFILSRGFWSGGSINLAASQDVLNNRIILNTAFNKHTSSGFTFTPEYVSSHSGSTIIKAGRDISNSQLLNANQAFWQIHPPLNNILWARFLNAGQFGSSMYLLAGRNIQNNTNAIIGAQALTYRDGSVGNGANNPANAFGGIITMRRGGTFTNNGSITVDGTSLFGNSGNFAFTSDAGLAQVNSRDGNFIQE